MSTAWTYEGEIASLGGPDETVTLAEGTTFCLSDRAGDIRAGRPQPDFLDTRFIAALSLRVNGRAVEPLGVAHPTPSTGTFFGRVTPGREGDEPLVVLRERRIGRGLVDTIELANVGSRTVTVHLELSVTTDFADLFEVKEQRPTSSCVPQVTVSASGLHIDGEHHGLDRSTEVRVDPLPDTTLSVGGPRF